MNDLAAGGQGFKGIAEPISDVLDESNLLDDVSDFVTCQQRLVRDGLIDIHWVRRTCIGSLFIDGHAVVVWSPGPAASA